MANVKKRNLKKALSVTIIIAVVFSVVSLGATKAVYDHCFPRYEATHSELSDELLSFSKSGQKISFESEDQTLTGYLYPALNNSFEGLIVVAEGFNSTTQDYIRQTKKFCESGYGVFIFDPTGCGESEGESAVGFSQQLLDLNAALDFISSEDNFGYSNIFLFGHSRGGYAVCCVAAYDHEIKAIASVNGINSAMEGVMMSASEIIGKIAYVNYPFLWLYQVGLFGADAVNASAVDILEDSKIPALIIHSSGDTTVPSDKFSIISHKDVIEAENIIWISDFGNQEANSHTEILFDEDGSANDELIKLITDFYKNTVKDQAEDK